MSAHGSTMDISVHKWVHTQVNMHMCQPLFAHYLAQKCERRREVEEKDRRTNSEERQK